MNKSFIMRLVALALVIVSVFSMATVASAATTNVSVGWERAFWGHQTDYSPCIFSAKSRNSTVLEYLGDVYYADIKMNTNSAKWVRCRYGSSEGYLPFFQCEFNSEEFYEACFGGYALQRGFAGQPVRNLQVYLNYVNNAGLTVDGSFGSATEAAVIAFQQRYNLVADGIAGFNTASKILDLLTSTYSRDLMNIN